MKSRQDLLSEWGRYIAGAAQKGGFGSRCKISRIESIAGPRAGVLELQAGLGTEALLKGMNKSNCANLRQFIPWDFPGEPSVYMRGRFIHVEAGWPSGMAENMIRLRDLSPQPRMKGRWVVGKNERGRTVIAGLSDHTPHYLMSGITGSGKSVAMRNAVFQLCKDESNQIILLDGKYGESLQEVSHLRGVVGPVATELHDMQSALGWAVAQMRRRYEARSHDGRLIIAFDEFQEYTGDRVISGLLKKLSAQGRAAGVHVLAATQHPRVGAFGAPETRRQFDGKIALRVADADASRVAVGGPSPRADHLQNKGDTYAVSSKGVHRLQGAYVDASDYDAEQGGEPLFTEWPEYDAGAVGQDLPQKRSPGRPRRAIEPSEIGVALLSEIEEESSPSFKARMEETGHGRPGSDRARSIMVLGRSLLEWLAENGIGLVYLDETD